MPVFAKWNMHIPGMIMLSNSISPGGGISPCSTAAWMTGATTACGARVVCWTAPRRSGLASRADIKPAITAARGTGPLRTQMFSAMAIMSVRMDPVFGGSRPSSTTHEHASATSSALLGHRR